MSLINRSLPSLIGGVSQQPAPVRHLSQVDAMENMVPSVASGLRKRTGTQFINKLSTVDHSQAFVHTINRGTEGISERYFVVINGGDLAVYDFRGNPLSVSFPNGKAYLAADEPRSSFHAVTVADHTFIVNKGTTVTVTAGLTPSQPVEYHVVIKLGVAKTAYHVNLGGVDYAYTTDDTTFDTLTIADQLTTAINGGTGFTATRTDNVIAIVEDTPAGLFQASVTDSYGDQAMIGFFDNLQRFEDLPKKFLEDRIVRIAGDPNNANNAWFVKWERSETYADGIWVETTAGDISYAFDATTMPHELVRNGDGTFTFQQVTWAERTVGDDGSNPIPSFVDTTISAVFFHRNRLGFLADENIILSQAGDYFNFWSASARTAIDSDPIDVSSTSTKVTLLKHVIPFDKSLLVFSDKQQFQFATGDTLTARTASLHPTTAYEMNVECAPVALGRNVFFATARGPFTAIREYYYDGNTVTSDAVDVTAHCPSYVPMGVFRLTAAATEDMLFALTDDEPNCLYVYNSYWNGDEKAQSAWHKWVFDAGDTIVSADVFATTLTLIVQRADGVYLDMVELEETPYSPASFTICMDRWVGYATGTYDSSQRMTFWNLPFVIPSTATVRVVVCNKTGEEGQGKVATTVQGNSIGLRGNYTGEVVVIGVEYDGWYRLTKQYAKDRQDRAITSGRLQLRDMLFEYSNTGYFEVRITPTGRDTSTYVFASKPLGLSSLILGTQTLVSGRFRAPVMAKSDEVVIEVHNATHLPSVFLSAEWHGHLALQAAR